MAYITRCLLVITAIFSLVGPRAVSGLSIDDVIMLSQNRYKAENIVDIILTTGSAFTLTATHVVHLKTVGVSDSVVQAMLVVVPPQSRAAETDSTGNTDWLNVTLQDLLLLADSEVSDAVILSFIRSRETAFTVGASEIVKLREAGLSDVAIQYLFLQSKTIADPVGYYEPPTGSVKYYPPAISMETYPETITLNRYSSAVPFYAYPRYYYGPSVFIRFGRVQHTLLDQYHVGLHHHRGKHQVGLHHRRDHYVGLHDNGKGQHIGLHHLAPEHIRKHHSVNNSNTHRPGINKSHSMNNDRGHSAIRKSGPNVKENNGPEISRNRNQSADHGFNRHVLRRSGNKSGASNDHTIKRNSARIASKSPTVSRTTHHSVKNASQAYSGRSISRTSTHKRSLKNSQSADHGFNRHVLRRSGNKSGASNDHTIKRNSARIASKSPTVSRTTHHSVKNSSQAYSGRSISRTSRHRRR